MSIKSPEPRVRENHGIPSITPAHTAFDASPEEIAAYQQQALEMCDDLRQKILDGEVIGFALAGVTAHQGSLCMSRMWTDGAGAYPCETIAAIRFLDHAFADTVFGD